MPTGADHRQRVVVDASALVSLLIDPGDAGESVADAMRDAELCAPHILPFEVANVLRRRRNAGLLSRAEAELAYREMLHFPIELWPWEALAERAWRLGANLSSYDAAYVALAEATGSTLLTRDARLASAPGVACEVHLVP